ncbi:MAG: hypothetical protein HGA70_01620 [Chlorobiaceae bacterium]|jgi:hypothetical protein|nr:hypothetical protein [Chlorobiaceae bacterium]NTW10232.1 hypothetical protein [Chlorobiaceae bacterium]
MEIKVDAGREHFREKIIATMFFGFRTVTDPVSIRVHPELMMKIRDHFRDKAMAPKIFDDVEIFFGLPVIEDSTKDKNYIAVV